MDVGCAANSATQNIVQHHTGASAVAIAAQTATKVGVASVHNMKFIEAVSLLAAQVMARCDTTIRRHDATGHAAAPA
eukprot:SAG25_NODE_111_length_14954_cov_8.187950_9_plen_77_part_00